jgi:hypothetical protein
MLPNPPRLSVASFTRHGLVPDLEVSLFVCIDIWFFIRSNSTSWLLQRSVVQNDIII